MVNAVKVFTLRLCISAYYIHFKRVKVKIFTAFTIGYYDKVVNRKALTPHLFDGALSFAEEIVF